jgi:uncharacterized membrane protein YkoI
LAGGLSPSSRLIQWHRFGQITEIAYQVQQCNIQLNSLNINHFRCCTLGVLKRTHGSYPTIANLLARPVLIAVLLLGFVDQSLGAPGAKGMAAQLPPAVRQTLVAAVGAGPLEDVERKVENGEAVFEITVRRAGVERNLTVTAAGRLASKQMFLNELPENIRRSIQTQAGNNGLGEIDWVDDDGDISYAFEIVKNAKKYDVTLSEDGVLHSLGIDLADAPEPVRKAVAAQIDAGKVTSISKNFEDDEISYYVEGTRGAKKRSINLSPDGAISNETVELADTPPAVQKAIKEQAAGARLSDIDRIVEDDDVMFDVKVIRAGKKQGFTVGEDGTLLAVKLTVAELPPPVRKELTARVGSGHIYRLEKAIDGSEITYEVEAKVKGKKIDFTLNPDGTEAQ